MKLSIRSEQRLAGLHPDLVKVVQLAAEQMPADLGFMVVEGLRTQARQVELMRSGASQTMKSRHLNGHAVDLAATVGGTIRWDWPLYHRLAPVVKGAAAHLRIPIEWGGDWVSFKDGPHWQLPWNAYPSSAPLPPT